MKLRKLSVLVLSLMMVLTMSASVFAADPVPSSDGSKASLVKYLKIAEGVTVPEDAEFVFNFAPVTPDDGNVANVKGPAHTYTFTDDDLVKADGSNLKAVADLNTVFHEYEFPHAGIYTFTVTEKKGAETVNDGTMSYSSQSYTLRFSYSNDGVIDDVTVTNGNGEKVTPDDIDPSDDGDNDPATTSGFSFTNSYTKTVSNHEEPSNPNPDPEDPSNPPEIENPDNPMETKEGAFVLRKYVLGKFGDQTKDFQFTVNIELPETAKDFNSLPAGMAEGDNTVNLKHEGYLTFGTLPVGTKITVTELDYSPEGYVKNVTTSVDNAEVTILVGENGGYAIYRNCFQDENVTPTGIVINNLPYILLIGLALGGIILFTRKRRYE